MSSIVRRAYPGRTDADVCWYSGGLENEKFDPPQRLELTMDETFADSLYHMEEDVLYIVRNDQLPGR